jgi:hypothetical protein
MRIGYLTLDEVNENLARRLAARLHVQLERLSFSEDSSVDCFDARLYEVDYLTPGDRQRLFARLMGSSPDMPVAVHGFHLRRREARSLRAAGIAVFRRLDARVFRYLVRIAREHAGSPMRLLTRSC